jgi:hypothetical protein
MYFYPRILNTLFLSNRFVINFHQTAIAYLNVARSASFEHLIFQKQIFFYKISSFGRSFASSYIVKILFLCISTPDFEYIVSL